jgi:hypothetical protein
MTSGRSQTRATDPESGDGGTSGKVQGQQLNRNDAQRLILACNLVSQYAMMAGLGKKTSAPRSGRSLAVSSIECRLSR